MDVKKLESRIKKLKGKLAEKGTAGAGAKSGLNGRETRKKLKRAQRRRKTLLVRAAFIDAKGKKKENKSEGEKGAP